MPFAGGMQRQRAFVLFLSALCACASGTERVSAGDVVEDTAGIRDSIAGTAAASLNENRVIGLLGFVHATDSAVGALGAQRGSTREIRDFALMIMREHVALRRSAALIADGLNLEIEAPRVAPAQAPAQLTEALLSTPNGPGWDGAYIEYVLAAHDASMENMARALAATKSPATREHIEKSVPILQKHIDKAKSLRKGQPAGNAATTPNR